MTLTKILEKVPMVHHEANPAVKVGHKVKAIKTPASILRDKIGDIIFCIVAVALIFTMIALVVI